MKKQYFLLAFFFYAIAVFYLSATTPITAHEAKILYTSNDIVSTLMRWGDGLGMGFIGFRVFFIFFGFLSIGLFYELSRRYFKKDKDVYLSTLIFMFLPGILTATTMVNVAILVLPLVLLFVLLHEKGHYLLLPPIMLALFFIHEASIIFFIAVLIYSVMHKEKKLAIFSLSFLLAFVYLAKGIEIGGQPSGHFVEIFGLYATVFSPLLFLYFFFAMYRILLRERKTLIWYISFTALAFSLTSIYQAACPYHGFRSLCDDRDCVDVGCIQSCDRCTFTTIPKTLQTWLYCCDVIPGFECFSYCGAQVIIFGTR